MEEELIQLPCLHCIRLNAWHQLRSHVVEVAHVAREVAQHDVGSSSAFPYKCVVNWHSLSYVIIVFLSIIFVSQNNGSDATFL